MLAGVGVTATAANATIVTGATIALGSILIVAAEHSSNNYQKARSNKEANQWAKHVGEKSAESLKEIYVGKSNIAKFNMLRDKETGEIVLEMIKTGIKVATDLFLK